VKRSTKKRSGLQPGRTVAGKYRLNELLGVGGMATVWSATNVFTERSFAIKFLLPSVARTDEASRRFLMEAKASARIDHPNIIEVIDVGQAEDGSLFMVMELLTGESLEAVIAGKTGAEEPMRLFDFCAIMLEVARALAAAHANGVIHRDLKPTNVFLNRDRQGRIVPKVLDFGVSKFLAEDRLESLTVTGTILGSPMYMSPEQAQGSRNIDGRTDIFAFGAILFEALVGYRCFEANTVALLIVAVATTEPRSIDACAPHLPAPLRDLVRGCLVANRNGRIASFEEVIARLAHLLPHLERDPTPIATRLHPEDDLDTHDSRDGRSATQVRRPAILATRRRKVFSLLGLAAVVAAVTFVVAYTSWRSVPRVTATVATAPLVPPLVPLTPSALPPATSLSLSREVEGAAAAGATADPPVVSVDSLPPAERATAHAARHVERAEKKGTGHLHVTSANPACTLYVDGAAQGNRDVELDVPVGSHRLRCDVGDGDPKTPDVSVTVAEGDTTKYTFE